MKDNNQPNKIIILTPNAHMEMEKAVLKY